MIRMTRFAPNATRLAFIVPLAALLAACGAAPDAPVGASTGPPAASPSKGSAASDASTGSVGSEGSKGSAGSSASTDDSGASTGSPDSGASTGSPDSGASSGSPDSGASMGSRGVSGSTDSGASPPAAVPAPSLGSASTFAVLGASTVTCANLSAVVGDVGVSPGTAITGFDPGCTITGTLHAGDAVAAQAHADLATAYGALKAVVCQHDMTGKDLGGQTLAPGVYCFNTTVGLTGALTLDGGGDSAATWIFQIGTAMTTGTNSSVVMAGSGKPGNVFWQVGSSATIAIGTAFQGNILASASITLVSGSRLVGRAFALNAAVTSDDNAVSLP
jgi:hypothetical protein